MELRGGRPPLPVPLDDRARRPRPGHRARRPVELGRRGRAPRVAPHRVDRGARARLPGAAADPRRRQPPAARGGPRRAGRPVGAPRRPGARAGAVPRRRPARPHRRGGARPGRRLVVGRGWSSRRPGGTRWPPPSATPGSTSAPGPGAAWPRVVTLLDPPEAKGLEFDAVVVVEPSAIHTDARGGRLLYIALTRAVQALAIVHAEPLPAALVGLTKEPATPGSTLGPADRPPAAPSPCRTSSSDSSRSRPSRASGWPASGVALVPAMQGLGDAGRSDEAMIDLGPLDQRSYVYAADGIAAHHPPGRDRPAAGARWRRSRSTPSTPCSRWRTPTSTPTTA